MISTLIFSYIVVAILDLLSFFFLSDSVPISIFIIIQLVSGLTGFIHLKRKDVNVIYFVENQLKSGAPVIKEIWFEFMVITGCLLLCMPGYISDIIGFLLMSNKVQIFIYQELKD